MSYDIYVNGKNMGQIASNLGWHDTSDWLEEHGKEHGKSLATTGEVPDGAKLAAEIDNIKDTAPEDIKAVLEDIAKYYSKGSTIAISQESDDEDYDTEDMAEHLVEPSRDVLPHEEKHNFAGHCRRQDATATAIRRIIASAKQALMRDAAERASHLSPDQLDTLTLRFDKTLQARLARSLTLAYKYGYQQVYAERYRAVGKSKKEPVVRKLKYEALTEPIEVTVEQEDV